MLRWLAGSEVVQVEAKMANLVHKEIQVEDWGMATLTLLMASLPRWKRPGRSMRHI